MPGQRLFSQLLFDRVVWHYGVRVNNVKVQNVEVGSTDMQHRWIIAVLSATTFCSFLREFSPLEVCAG